jgi:uncharacterized protein (DUF983 family)
MGTIRACWDDTCPRCKKRSGWRGYYAQRPACSRCGFSYPADKLKAMEAEMEAESAEFHAMMAERRRRREGGDQ